MKSLQKQGIEPPNYHLTLYIAGDEPNSRLAIRNLREICTGVLADQCVIEVIDVYIDFERALKARVVVTPMLIVVGDNPATKATFYGTLHDKKILLKYLEPESNGNE